MKSKNIFLILFFFITEFCFTQDLTSISLDGKWEVIYDYDNKSGTHNIGEITKLFDSNNPEVIKVPSCLESVKKDFEGVAIYKKSFLIPEIWENRNIEITFNAVNYLAEVWLNNEVVGTHKGGYTPFTFRLNETVKVGDTNTIFLRAVTPIVLTDQRIDGIGRLEVPSWRGAINGGIWQGVYLKSFGKIKIEDVFIKSDYQTHVVNLEINLENTISKDAMSEMKIKFYDLNNNLIKKLESQINLNPGQNLINQQIVIENAKNWEPNSPNLYKVQVEVNHAANKSDYWSYKFGLENLQ